MKSKLCRSLLIAAAIVVSGCGQAASAGADEPTAASLARFQPREDGWRNDPANQPHPNDPNPLRRKLGDSPLKQRLFELKDLRVFTACVKQHAGVKLVSAESAYLSKCLALQQDLIRRAEAAGFKAVTPDNVFDAHLVRLSVR